MINIQSQTEARRLFLYHLTQLFFHGQDTEIAVEGTVEGDLARVKIKMGDGESEGWESLDLSLHKTRSRAENVALGKAFAKAGGAFTSYVPPYGTLVGVRPVKVPLFYLKEGMDRESLISLLRSSFLVSEQKADLLYSLAQLEMEFSASLSPDSALLYVSIPFCPSRCSYCSFISSAAPEHLSLIPAYLEQLKIELALMAETLKKAQKKLVGIYIGGGTPGILTAAQLEDLIGHIHGHFSLEDCIEFSVEMGRPDTITKEKMDVVEKMGVDRISINSQTTCNATLARIGRRHSAEDFFRAMDLAKNYSFSINCDLITSLPGEDCETFLTSVEETLALDPESLTIHALCRKKSAQDKGEAPLSSGWVRAVEKAYETCREKGLFPYYLYRQKMSAADLENLGFAKEGNLGVYNLAMMEDLCDVFACGAGAISKIIPKKSGDKIERFASFKYPFEYLRHPEKMQENIEKMKTHL